MSHSVAELGTFDVAILVLEQACKHLDRVGTVHGVAHVRMAIKAAGRERHAMWRTLVMRNMLHVIIEDVLTAYSMRVTDNHGKLFEAIAVGVIKEIDIDRVGAATAGF